MVSWESQSKEQEVLRNVVSAGIVAYTRSKENGEQKKSVNSAPVRSGRAEQQVTLLQQDYSSGAVLSIA